MTKRIDITGKRYGMYSVLEYKGGSKWKCKCDCGETRNVQSIYLRNGQAKSCGCRMKDIMKDTGNPFYKHGMSKTRFYQVWLNMIKRCTDTTSKSYKYYGGRGIRVCDRWNEFMNFKDDMYNSYDSSLTIDRIDNDKGYSQENCHWVTYKEQNNNKRSNVIVEYNGEHLNISQLAKKLNIDYMKLYHPLHKGRSLEDTLKKLSLI